MKVRTLNLTLRALLATLSLAFVSACGGGGGDTVESKKDTDMPAGLQVVNDYGTIQIDQDYANFTLKSRGTTAFSSTGNMHTAEVSVYGAHTPILCIRSTGQFTSVQRTLAYSPGGLTRWKVVGDSPGSFDWFVFDSSKFVPATSGVGLAVYDSSGNQTYHSDLVTMDVIHAFYSNLPSMSQTSSYSLAASNVAVCLANPKEALMAYGGGGAGALLLVEGAKIVGSTLNVKMFPVQQIPIPMEQIPPSPINSNPTQVIIVDLSNL